MVFVYTAMGVLCVEHANVLKLCYIELLSGDGSFRLFSLVVLSSFDENSFKYCTFSRRTINDVNIAFEQTCPSFVMCQLNY